MSSAAGNEAGSWGTFERDRVQRPRSSTHAWLLAGSAAFVVVGLVCFVSMSQYSQAPASSVLVESKSSVSAHQEQLSESECCSKDFEPKDLYNDPKEIDGAHPNRIDFYGPMFHNFPEGSDTVMEKGETKIVA